MGKSVGRPFRQEGFTEQLAIYTEKTKRRDQHLGKHVVCSIPEDPLTGSSTAKRFLIKSFPLASRDEVKSLEEEIARKGKLKLLNLSKIESFRAESRPGMCGEILTFRVGIEFTEKTLALEIKERSKEGTCEKDKRVKTNQTLRDFLEFFSSDPSDSELFYILHFGVLYSS